VTDLGGGGWDIFSYHGISERFVDGFLHLSEYAKSLASFQSAKHSVIYGSVDTRNFHPLNLSRERSVLFVGRLLPHKGIDCLIQAVDQDTPLKIIGWPYFPKYFEDLKRLSIGKSVEFITDADDEILLREYNKAGVVVLPSVYTNMYGGHSKAAELLGLTVLESMACKKPVVVTDVGSLPELVQDGNTGFVVKPNDPVALREKIYSVLNNPEAAMVMGERGYNLFLERFQRKHLVTRVLNAYLTQQAEVTTVQ
jgi:glycosyltransferase involved in cell wall biosynthesis